MENHNAMLGRIVRTIVTVPCNMWGTLVDLFEKLCSRDGEVMFTNLRKLLRKQNIVWNESEVDTVSEPASSIRTLFVAPLKSMKQLLEGCGNDTVDHKIAENFFPIPDADCGEWEYDLWNPRCRLTADVALVNIVESDPGNPWEPARLPHLLVFGTLFPDEQRDGAIVALGAISSKDDWYTAKMSFLCERSAKRELCLSPWNSGVMHVSTRFLRVRRVKKSIASH